MWSSFGQLGRDFVLGMEGILVFICMFVHKMLKNLGTLMSDIALLYKKHL